MPNTDTVVITTLAAASVIFSGIGLVLTILQYKGGNKLNR